MDCPRVVLRPSVTREWVDEGRLPNEWIQSIQSKVAKTLWCVGKGHMWWYSNPSSSHKDQNTLEMSPGGDMMQWIMVEQFKAIRHTQEKYHVGLDYTKVWSRVIRNSTLVNNMMVRRAIDSRSECYSIAKSSLLWVHRIWHQMKALIINIWGLCTTKENFQCKY